MQSMFEPIAYACNGSLNAMYSCHVRVESGPNLHLLPYFFKIKFFKAIFHKHYQSIKRLRTRSGLPSVGPGLCEN